MEVVVVAFDWIIWFRFVFVWVIFRNYDSKIEKLNKILKKWTFLLDCFAILTQ